FLSLRDPAALTGRPGHPTHLAPDGLYDARNNGCTWSTRGLTADSPLPVLRVTMALAAKERLSMPTHDTIPNFIAGRWHVSAAVEALPITNPATAETIARVGLCGPAEVNQAVVTAAAAFPAWSRTPAVDRVQFLFKLKFLLEEHLEELARTIV